MQARYQATLQPEQGRVTKRHAASRGKCFLRPNRIEPPIPRIFCHEEARNDTIGTSMAGSADHPVFFASFRASSWQNGLKIPPENERSSKAVALCALCRGKNELPFLGLSAERLGRTAEPQPIQGATVSPRSSAAARWPLSNDSSTLAPPIRALARCKTSSARTRCFAVTSRETRSASSIRR